MNVVDVDECANDADDCDDGAHFECSNTDGSFECNCSSGYVMDGGGNCVGELDFKCAYNLQCSSCIMKPVF